MPNKHKMAKLRLKMLASGKLRQTDEARNTLKYLKNKAAIDYEDVDYGYDIDKYKERQNKNDDGELRPTNKKKSNKISNNSKNNSDKNNNNKRKRSNDNKKNTKNKFRKIDDAKRRKSADSSESDQDGGSDFDDDDDDDDDDSDDEPKKQKNGAKIAKDSVAAAAPLEKKNKKDKNAKKESPMDKLKASRFRYLNEILYTQTSDESFELFEKDQDSFKAYHEGFKNQIEKWPINPLDEMIKFIKKKSSNLVVADFGCGEARLARSVPNKVHSFDLAPLNDLVTKCDMKNVPLNSESCDIVVFCLSLMGLNLTDFICEAHRVLKMNGILKIAEVASRIDDRRKFIDNIQTIGFRLNKEKTEEKVDKKYADYFYFFEFTKTSKSVKSRPDIKLLPCLYKKR